MKQEQKISLGEMRSSGVRATRLSLMPPVVDQWPDDVRLSDLKPSVHLQAHAAGRVPTLGRAVGRGICQPVGRGLQFSERSRGRSLMHGPLTVSCSSPKW
jgi:hypothetical protein